MDIKNKIDTAINVTSDAQNLWNKAFDELDGSVTTNGYGIYTDQTQLQGKLLRAKKHIEQALKLLNDTSWPTAADYDEFD